jgi:hypothetical protein
VVSSPPPLTSTSIGVSSLCNLSLGNDKDLDIPCSLKPELVDNTSEVSLVYQTDVEMHFEDATLETHASLKIYAFQGHAL